jgi:hypothetical protein
MRVVNMKKLFILAIALSIILASTTCGDTRTYSINRGISHFSFEYPTNFHVTDVEVRTDYNYTSLSIEGPNEKSQNGAVIGLLIIKANPDYPSAKEEMEKGLHFVSGFPNFRLIENADLTILNMAAQQFIFYYSDLPDPNFMEVQDLHPRISRNVYFEYGENIWNVSLDSSDSSFETNQSIFENIVASLEIKD